MAFTWSAISFPFWANSVPNSSGGASTKLVSSPTSGRRALLMSPITFTLRRLDMWAFALPMSSTAAFTALTTSFGSLSSPLWWVSSNIVRGANESSSKVWTFASGFCGGRSLWLHNAIQLGSSGSWHLRQRVVTSDLHSVTIRHSPSALLLEEFLSLLHFIIWLILSL